MNFNGNFSLVGKGSSDFFAFRIHFFDNYGYGKSQIR